MHEASLSRQILDVVLERTEGQGARHVRLVRGWVAETEALSAASLRLHFAAHAHGTRAEGAELELRVLHVEARCRSCGERYRPDHHLLLCPTCGSSDGDLLGKTGMGIESVDVN